MTNKGKEVAGKDSSGKRKRSDGNDKYGGGRKTRNRGVLQFFEGAAEAGDTDDSFDSDFDDDFLDEDFDTVQPTKNEPFKAHSLPVFPKEEEMDEEEYDKMMEGRYSSGSTFATHAAEEYDDKPFELNSLATAIESMPTIWKVKCTVGRERHSAFCLMQKFIELKSLGNKLQIISAFAVDHMKGYIYIEAEKQYDIYQACSGISGIYVTRMHPLPKNEILHLFSVRSRCNEVSVGMWARVKNGKYKGDLAQVVAVNNTQKKVTVKLIPRIDLQALAAKFGGGHRLQNNDTPAARLISSSELEEFRPLMHYRRDRETGRVFEVLDGLMLKDGYLYKKLSIDSLNFWGVVPKDEEVLKFAPSENTESNEMQWLTQIYGEPKKKRTIGGDKGGEKGEGSSSSSVVNGFEMYDLVCFSKKDFGVIIGMDKDDTYKILKESPDGPVAMTVERRNIKCRLFDIKFSAQDQQNKTITVNDTVRIIGGPSEGKQGIVRYIYRGIVFIYDGNDEENGGYITAKSHMCEKVKLSAGDCSEKGHEPDSSVFEDLPTSPKSPLSPEKPWQAREHNREFSKGNDDGLYTIGQTVRIRVGPLKGYLCRVIAIRRSDVTVKLDSQQKVLTVKCEHLSEVQGKRTATSSSVDPDSSKPFDLMGSGESSGGWTNGIGASAGGDGWNTGGVQPERSAWSNPSKSNFPQSESLANPISSEGDASGKEDNAWGVKSTSVKKSSWGAAADNAATAADPEDNAWGVKSTAVKKSSWGGAAADSAGTAADPGAEDNAWGVKNTAVKKSTWGAAADNAGTATDLEAKDNAWGIKRTAVMKSSWGAAGENAGTAADAGAEAKDNAWGVKRTAVMKSSWGGAADNAGTAADPEDNAWGVKSTSVKKSSWAAGAEDAGTAADSGQSGGWGRREDGWSQAKPADKMDGDKASGWNHKSNRNTSKVSGGDPSSWGQKSDENIGDQSGQSYCNREKTSNKSPAAGWGQGSGQERGLADGRNSNTNWGAWKSGSSEANEVENPSITSNLDKNQDGGWKTKSNLEDDSGRNSDSVWGSRKPSSSDVDGDQPSGWNHKSNWNAPKASRGEPSGWGQKSDAGNQDSNWGRKSNWNSGSGDQDTNWNSGNDSSGGKFGGGDETSGDGGYGGNWGGGNGGRGGSDRGGFRGRGRFRGRGERGGFSGGRGNCGRFGGREGDRGGFGGGRGGDRGGFRGRGRSNREGFGGRWGSESGLGGRGRGRRDQPGGWSNKRDFGDDSSDWKKEADNDTEGWKNSTGSGTAWFQGNADKKEHSSWNQGGGGKKQWQSWGSEGEPSSTWNSKRSDQPADAKENPGWNKVTQSSHENATDKASSWNSHGDQGSGWNNCSATKEADETKIQEDGWNKNSSSKTTSGSWSKPEMNQKEDGWGQSSATDKGQSSSWNASNAGGAGSWGKKNDGAGSSGW